MEKEFPESKEQYPHIPGEVRRIFWTTKGLRYGYIDDPELSLKIGRAEFLADLRWKGEGEMQAPQLEKIDKELSSELLDFLEREFPEGEIHSRLRFMELFWEQKGITLYG